MFNIGDVVRRKKEFIDEMWWVEVCKRHNLQVDGDFTVKAFQKNNLYLVEAQTSGYPNKFELVTCPKSIEEFL